VIRVPPEASVDLLRHLVPSKGGGPLRHLVSYMRRRPAEAPGVLHEAIGPPLRPMSCPGASIRVLLGASIRGADRQRTGTNRPNLGPRPQTP